jgi:hypothetical protein
LNWPLYLGPLDPIPDVSFQVFLGIISKQFGATLDYLVVRPPSHVRIVARPHNPSDPESLQYPISARDQGTTVDCEAIEGMLDKFNMTHQQFRDAYNSHYNLSAKSPHPKATPLPKIPKA